ncbi:hypothetical protein R6Q59_035751 [Mikania micrantha]
MATSSSTIEMPKVKLGNQGLEVSRLGITFFDTADIYGVDFANETLIEKLLKELPRDKIQLATKFGIFKIESNKVTVKGTPEYARSCCEGSLKRLGVEYIDLFYVHRIDTTIPIEDTETWNRHCSICPCWPGFFGGKAIKESLPEDSVLGLNARLTGENLTKKQGSL